MRPFFGCETDDDAGAGTPPPPPDHAAELAAAKAANAELETKLGAEKQWADAARSYDSQLAKLPADQLQVVQDMLAGRAPAADVADNDDLDDATKLALAAMQTKVNQSEARYEALNKQIQGINGARVEDNINAQIAQARTEMGSDVVDALLPGIEDQVRANTSLTGIPGGVLTLLRAADHGSVATRLKDQEQADADARAAKLARTRGLPARSLNVETTPGSNDKPLSALDALNLAIRTNEERTALTR